MVGQLEQHQLHGQAELQLAKFILLLHMTRKTPETENKYTYGTVLLDSTVHIRQFYKSEVIISKFEIIKMQHSHIRDQACIVHLKKTLYKAAHSL
jgi:hypothetical protein